MALLVLGSSRATTHAQGHDRGTNGQPATDTPTFRTAVDLVSVALVVRDRRGRVVRDLSASDFEVYDGGQMRKIVEFAPAEDGPISIAVLVDVSGSMQVGSGLDAARRTMAHLVSWMRPAHDEIALFAFDTRLEEVLPFTNDPQQLLDATESLEAWGQTSLYDAIEATARRITQRATRRRAIVVLTDGVDTSSRFSPAQVSQVASATDVPVYVVAVVPAADHESVQAVVDGRAGDPNEAELANLSWWTGGSMFVVSTASQASSAVRTLLAELRHQYVLAFHADGASGWRPLDIRLRRRDFTVKARSGYFAANRVG